MIGAFYIPLLCALALAAGAPPVSRSAAPRIAATTLVAAALTVASAADAALGLLAGVRLLDAPPLAALLGWRAERPGSSIPVPLPISLIAGLVLALVAALAWRSRRRSRSATESLRRLHADLPAGELVVVPSAEMLAHALPGPRNSPGRIVVSDAMLRALDPDERRVLLAHERSHLRHRHDRYLALARVASRINPLVQPAVAATALLLERWADEDAAGVVGSRRLAARALARAALASAASDRPAPHPGFAADRVATRVTTLLAAAPSRVGRLMPLLPAALGVAAALGAAAATHELAHLFDVLRGDG